MELTTVEVFDPHFNTWKPQTSMTMVRSVRSQEPHVQTEQGPDTQQQNPPGPSHQFLAQAGLMPCVLGGSWNHREGIASSRFRRPSR